MKTFYLLWLLAFVTVPGVSAGFGFSGSGNNEQEEAAVVNVEESSKTVEASISALDGTGTGNGTTTTSNRTLKTIIKEERRFLLFNSRHLTGECRKLIYDV